MTEHVSITPTNNRPLISKTKFVRSKRLDRLPVIFDRVMPPPRSLVDSRPVKPNFPGPVDVTDNHSANLTGAHRCQTLYPDHWSTVGERRGSVRSTARGGTNTKLEWSAYLQGREVVILPDNDKPGYEYALKTADSLLKSGNKVKIVFLYSKDDPNHIGSDIADWGLEPGNDLEKFKQLPRFGTVSRLFGTMNLLKRRSLNQTGKRFHWTHSLQKTREFIQETAKSIGIDPAFIGPQVLSAFSGIIGRI